MIPIAYDHLDDYVISKWMAFSSWSRSLSWDTYTLNPKPITLISDKFQEIKVPPKFAPNWNDTLHALVCYTLMELNFHDKGFPLFASKVQHYSAFRIIDATSASIFQAWELTWTSQHVRLQYFKFQIRTSKLKQVVGQHTLQSSKWRTSTRTSIKSV